MKDLFVYCADADAAAVMKALLDRPNAMKLRDFTFDVDRYAGRDAGMVKNGPETIRQKPGLKDQYHYVLLLWDHKGSGWEGRTVESARNALQQRLDRVTWEGRSAAVAICPELEEWLWHDSSAIRTYLGLSVPEFSSRIQRFCEQHGLEQEAARRGKPKELWRHLYYSVKRKSRPLPKELGDIARNGDVDLLARSESFSLVLEILRNWFPNQLET